jgi:hypothetical protein
MSTLLFILALFSFICGWSFILGGFIGMLDFDTPKSTRGYLFQVADLIFTNGFNRLFQSVVNNWSSRPYEQRTLMTGCGCLVPSVALALVATRCP